VWCDGSEMTVQEDRCPHKGVPLSLGRTTKDRVKCPYHGMEFGADGACRRIPQYADQSRIPSNFGVKTYPTRLAYGVLWLWWGDGAPEGNVPYFEEVASETRLTRSASAEFPVSFMRVMESHFDLYHVDYIHGWPLRMGRVVEDAQVVVDGRRIRCDTCFATGGFQIGMKARSTILFPALSLQEYGPGMSFKLVAAATPIDERKTWFFMRHYVPLFRMPIVGRLLNALNNRMSVWKVLPEDARIQSRQQPWEGGVGADRLVIPADRGIAEYWRMVKEAEK